MNNAKPIEKSDVPAVIKSKEELLPQLIDPEQQVEFASRAAKALTAIINTKPKKLMIGNEQYLEFEDWQTIARFYNITVGVDWTREIMREGKLVGFEAKANVYNAAGTIISSAEASCLRDEPNWKIKPEFQLKSMAQTRASAKALRNVLAWVVVLAGFKTTPAEEMEGVNGYGNHNAPPFPPRTVAPRGAVKPPAAASTLSASVCGDCHTGISKAESDFSQAHYGAEFCRKCQAKYKKIK